MKPSTGLLALSVILACAIALVGCGAAEPEVPTPSPVPSETQTETTPPTEPAEEPAPVDLLEEIKAADYARWTPAPGNENRVAAKGPHGDEVRILLDPTAEKGLASGGDRWPVDSIIAKDIYRDGELIQIAAMKKTADGWYWGEWDAQGKPIVEGVAAEPCEGCHAAGTDGTLGVVLE